MRNTRSKRSDPRSVDMIYYMRCVSEQNTNARELARLKRGLALAMTREVTPRQREILELYYGKGLNMTQIGRLLGVDKSTVSRTMHRGEARLRRCLRYTSEDLAKLD